MKSSLRQGVIETDQLQPRSDQSAHPVTAGRRPGRLAVLTKTFPKLSETFILQELLGLERQGYALDVFSLQPPTDSIQQHAVADLRAEVSYLTPEGWSGYLRQLGNHLALFATRPLGYLRAKALSDMRGNHGSQLFSAAVTLAWSLIRRRADHLHVHFANTPADVGELASIMTGIPFSLSAHAKDIYLSRPEDLRRKLTAAAFTVTCTEYNRQHLRRIAGPEAVVQRAYHGLGVAAFEPAARTAKPGALPLILSVGRLRTKKGFATLIEACHRLRDEGIGFRCCIVGYGPEEAALRQLIEINGLEHYISMPGKMTHDRLIELYREAALFALPSRVDPDGDRDGLPNVLLEAMAMELPVISTKISGIPEAIVDGETGFLIKPDDPLALAEKIRWLLDHPDKADAFGRLGRRLVEAKFEPTANLTPVIDLLGEAGIRPVPGSQLTAETAEIAYVLKGFPRFSEPFIANEISLLEQRGLTLRLYSIKEGDYRQLQPVITRINASITQLPTVDSVSQTPLLTWLRGNLGKFTEAHDELIRKRPVAYAITLLSALTMCWRYRKGFFARPRKVFIKEFLQAGTIANEILKQPRIVHLHGHFCHGATTVTWYVSRLTGIPFSFTAHAKDIYQGKLNPKDLLQRKLKAAAFTVTCTETNKVHLETLGPVDHKVHRVYHGLDLERFSPNERERERGARPDDPTILAVGRFTRKKGFPDLIDALALVAKAGCRFHCQMIGEPGDDSATVEARIQALGLEGRIEVSGSVPQHRLKHVYQDADLFVLPCRVVEDGDRDGIPNVLAEAMAMELPVISTTVSGIPEIVDDSVNGVLVPPSSPDRLAEAIIALLGDPAYRRKLGSAGRQKIRRMFDSSVTTGDLHALFAGAIAERVARAGR